MLYSKQYSLKGILAYLDCYWHMIVKTCSQVPLPKDSVIQEIIISLLLICFGANLTKKTEVLERLTRAQLLHRSMHYLQGESTQKQPSMNEASLEDASSGKDTCDAVPPTQSDGTVTPEDTVCSSEENVSTSLDVYRPPPPLIEVKQELTLKSEPLSLILPCKGPLYEDVLLTGSHILLLLTDQSDHIQGSKLTVNKGMLHVM